MIQKGHKGEEPLRFHRGRFWGVLSVAGDFEYFVTG